MSKGKTWAAIRDIIADRDGPNCFYCRTPTAATIEHLEARSNYGEHGIHNLVLACPYCNSARGNESLKSWRQRRGWDLTLPEKMPTSLDELLVIFPKAKHGRYLKTGSTNSRIKLQDQRLIIEVRSGKGYAWRQPWTGDISDSTTWMAAWIFMRRHNAK